MCHCLTTEVTDLGGEAGTPLLSGLTPLSPAPVPPLWDIHSCNVRLIDDLTTLGFPDSVLHEGRTALSGSCGERDRGLTKASEARAGGAARASEACVGRSHGSGGHWRVLMRGHSETLSLEMSCVVEATPEGRLTLKPFEV